ncbi:MAG: hypothetical protein J07HX64_00680 [halophilic archaeon J07HX64]|nr:MAG: hypothetical protein J07HX64_00680 [halophilic archaeon J07HX64]
MPSVPGGESPPKDLDGDGNHKSSFANSEVNVLDIRALFETSGGSGQTRPAVT